MKGSAFLEVASTLTGHQGEAWDRTRIGRLYYGIYLEYRQFCIDELGLVSKKFAREHQIVNDMIGTVDGDLSELLRELRLARNQADYDLDIPSQDIALLLANSESIAQQMTSALEQLRNGQT